MKKIVIPIVAILVIVLIYFISSGERFIKERDNNEIIVGVILPLTGAQAATGEEIKNSLLYAQEVLNKNSTHGSKVKLIIADSRDLPREAVSIFHKMIHNRPTVIITASTSVSMSLAPLAEKYKIPIVALLAADDKLPNINEWTFRFFPAISAESKSMAHYANKKLNNPSIAILAINTELGEENTFFFTKFYEKLGGEIHSLQKYGVADRDCRAQIAKSLSTKPEGIYVSGYGLGYCTVINQLKEANYSGHIMTMDILSVPYYQNATQSSNEGILFTGTLFNKDTNDQSRLFHNEYLERYNIEPSYVGAISYDALFYIASVVQNSERDSQTIRNNLLNKKDFEGLLGKLIFDSNGAMRVPLQIQQIRNKQVINVD